MNLFKIAQKNMRKNLSFYSLYLFSIAFVLMIFFSLISFSMDEVIMAKISSDGRVETMSRVVSIFIMGFVLFYMSYSNTFFLRKRIKELGIYALLGFRKSSITCLLIIENIFMCLIALVIGIFLGAFLHKGIIAIIIHFLDLSIDSSSIVLINFKAVYFSSVFVLAVLFILMISNWRFLRKSSLLELIRFEKKSEKKINVKIYLSILGIIFMITGYALALDIIRGENSLWVTIGFSPMAMLTLICVVIGTVFFIYSFIPYVILKIKNKKDYFYKEINIVSIPKFVYRIRSNARTLILLTLLSAATLCLLGSTTITFYYTVKGTSRIIPAAFEFPVENPEKVDRAINIAKEMVGEKNMQYKETDIIKVTASSSKLPFEYSAEKKNSFDLIRESDYKELLQLQNKKVSKTPLSDKDCILIKYMYDNKKLDKGSVYKLNVDSKENITVKVLDTTLNNPIGFANSVGTLVISDNIYEKISEFKPSLNKVMSIYGKDMRENKKLYESIYPLFKDNVKFASAFQKKNDIVYANSSTNLLIIFITLIFFIATGSILYFHNISGIFYDRDDFNILIKMGYNQNKIKKIIRKQIKILFCIPAILGTVHSIFALYCYKNLLMQDLLGQSSALILPLLISIGIFIIVYIIYYNITKYTCYKMILDKGLSH